MRRQWSRILKSVRQWAAPIAASLVVAPSVYAQTPLDVVANQEGRVSLAGAPLEQQFNPNSASAYSYAVPAHELPQGPLPIPKKESRYAQYDAANMVGTYFGPIQTVNFNAVLSTDIMGNPTETAAGVFDVPGANRVPNIAENNSAVPRDRFYFTYNHFQGAMSSVISVDDPNDVLLDMNGDPILDPITNMEIPGPPATSRKTLHQDRFTLGLEKTFFGDEMSLELRVPLIIQNDLSVQSLLDPTTQAVSYGRDDPNGNIALNFKRVLNEWEGCYASGIISGGAGITFAHADETRVDIGDASFSVNDSAYHFNPYLAVLISGKAGWFMQAFFEADFSTDSISVADQNGNFNRFDVPDFYNIDLGIGYWLTRNLHRRFLRGVAPLFEFHYARQRQDSGQFAFALNGANTTGVATFGNSDTRQDVYNFTSGVHVELSKHLNARAAGVFPFKDAPDRQFDAAFIFQLDLVR